MEVVSVSRPVARKQHICSMCGGIINKGEEYDYQVLKEDILYVWKQCDHCLPIVNKMFKEFEWYYDNGITSEAFWDYVRENPELGFAVRR